MAHPIDPIPEEKRVPAWYENRRALSNSIRRRQNRAARAFRAAQNRLTDARDSLAQITDTERVDMTVYGIGYGWDFEFEQTGLNEFEPRHIRLPWKVAKPFVTLWVRFSAPVQEAACALLTGHAPEYDGEDEGAPGYVYSYCRHCGKTFTSHW